MYVCNVCNVCNVCSSLSLCVCVIMYVYYICKCILVWCLILDILATIFRRWSKSSNVSSNWHLANSATSRAQPLRCQCLSPRSPTNAYDPRDPKRQGRTAPNEQVRSLEGFSTGTTSSTSNYVSFWRFQAN